jgi:tetratricopeptide (TPR) repeat protein
MAEDQQNSVPENSDSAPAGEAAAMPEAHPAPQSKLVEEVIPPSRVLVWRALGDQPARWSGATACLTSDSLWILHDDDRLQRTVLANLVVVDMTADSRHLRLALGPESASPKRSLAFNRSSDREHWQREIQSRLPTTTPQETIPEPERDGAVLIRGTPDTPSTALGEVEFAHQQEHVAERGLRLRAGALGADAVIKVRRQKYSEYGSSRMVVRGQAIRLDDPADRTKLRRRWLSEEVRRFVRHALTLLAVQAVLLFLVQTLFRTAAFNVIPTGETNAEIMESLGIALAVMNGWPLLMLALLWILRWRALFRPAGLAVLAVTTGRGLLAIAMFALFHPDAAQKPGPGLLCTILDPVQLAVIFFGFVLCRRAWRLARDASLALPAGPSSLPKVRLAATRTLWAGTLGYAIGGLAFLGYSGYETSSYLHRPGVDARRENEALREFNAGVAQSDRGDFGAAEQSYKRSARIWEELTAKSSAPLQYRQNLAIAVYNLGWLEQHQGRPERAEPFYRRVLEIDRAVKAAKLQPGDSFADETFSQCVVHAQRFVEAMESDRRAVSLEEKDRQGLRKYEEALVKSDKGAAPEAEKLLREAISLWEELLSQPQTEETRKFAIGRLGRAYLLLSQLQLEQGRRPDAESTLPKAIDYLEKAVALDPARILLKHSLESARKQKEHLRELAFEEEIEKLYSAHRFGEAVELCRNGIQTEEGRRDPDRELAAYRLSYLHERLAWLLAHCPDEHLRDTKAAVRHAHRCTELQPDETGHWFTLALVQYRNGDWRDSLKSVDQMKTRLGAPTASSLFLTAMNLHQLGRGDDARAAYRKGVEWIEKRQLEAEDNPLLRFQLESVRPAMESLKREAERLLQGKDASGDRIG